MSDKDIVEVTQADREAAASIAAPSPARREQCLSGQWDGGQIVQAFARHRLAHQPQAGEGVKERARGLLDEAVEAVVTEAVKSKTDHRELRQVPKQAALRAIEAALSASTLSAGVRDEEGVQ